jgi:hypothetical protein
VIVTVLVVSRTSIFASTAQGGPGVMVPWTRTSFPPGTASTRFQRTGRMFSAGVGMINGGPGDAGGPGLIGPEDTGPEEGGPDGAPPGSALGSISQAEAATRISAPAAITSGSRTSVLDMRSPVRKARRRRPARLVTARIGERGQVVQLVW